MTRRRIEVVHRRRRAHDVVPCDERGHRAGDVPASVAVACLEPARKMLVLSAEVDAGEHAEASVLRAEAGKDD